MTTISFVLLAALAIAALGVSMWANQKAAGYVFPRSRWRMRILALGAFLIYAVAIAGLLYMAIVRGASS